MIDISMYYNDALGDVISENDNSYKKCLTKQVRQRKIYPALCAEIKYRCKGRKTLYNNIRKNYCFSDR